MFLYKSISGYAEAEYVIEKSRFIAHASPADTPEEARLFVSQIKEKYKDATHNVPAFVCGHGMEHQWQSDDGEPSGTSGMPILRLITGEGLTNIVIVVTRYFGGIKLGTGGLARAYTHAAKLAIDEAGICEVRESIKLRYTFDYAYLAKLQNIAAEKKIEISNVEYAEAVSADLICERERRDEVVSLMGDLSGGKALLTGEEIVNAKFQK